MAGRRSRMADIDTAQARMQHSAGVSAIQTVWLYDRLVEVDRLAEFHGALTAGRLNRVVTPATLPAAGDRWSARARFAPLHVTERTVARSQLENWLADRAADHIDADGGPAWQLSAVRLDDGTSAVSLLVSHAVADARTIDTAVADAVNGRRPGYRYLADRYPSALRSALDRSAIAGRRLRSVASSLHRPQSVSSSHSDEATTLEFDDLDPNFRIPRFTTLIPIDDWQAAAAARGGSPTTLAYACIASLADRLGRVQANGLVRIAIPVSTRTGAHDTRANAVRGLRFDVDPKGLRGDLKPLRKLTKDALSEPAPHEGGLYAPDGRARAELAGTAWAASPPDFATVGCSSIGELDADFLRIDGAAAASCAIGLINRGIEDPSRLARFGGNLWSVSVEAAGYMSLRISAFDPRRPLDREQLTAEMTSVLADFGLKPTFW